MPEWALVVHGGAKEVAANERDANRAGVLRALERARAVLDSGGRAVDAVTVALRVLEDDPAFNAGYGSALNREGGVEVDAAVMDGATLNVGAVAGVAGLPHPVSVARALLEEPATLLVGEGAQRFAVERGLETCDPAALIAAPPASEGHDTVGCVALDRAGNLAAATSTGGLEGTLPGRVGDSPLAGCGFYADNALGVAVALSGHGEAITRMMLAARVVHGLETATLDSAIAAALGQLRQRVGGDAGCIAVTTSGELAWGHNSPDFPCALQTSAMPEALVYLNRGER
jgi:beta-aspartyl-peptidase (threonine type)